MKLLIVDDSKAMRMIVNRTLKQAGFGGHTILEASNGNESLSLIEKEKPDLVLSDWNMPEMKGIDLLRTLRAAGNHTRLGFITSESSSEIRRRGRRSLCLDRHYKALHCRSVSEFLGSHSRLVLAH